MFELDFSKFKSTITHVGKELFKDALFDQAVQAYINYCEYFVEEYLEYDKAGPNYVRSFRKRIFRVLRVTVLVLDNIDSYLSGRVVDRWAKINRIIKSKGADSDKKLVLKLRTKSTKISDEDA